MLVTFDKGGSILEMSLGRPGMHVFLEVTSETAAAGQSLRWVASGQGPLPKSALKLPVTARNRGHSSNLPSVL